MQNKDLAGCYLGYLIVNTICSNKKSCVNLICDLQKSAGYQLH